MLFFFTSKLFVGGLDGLLFLHCCCCGILSHFKIFPLSKMSLQRNRQNLVSQRAPKWKFLGTLKPCLVYMCPICALSHPSPSDMYITSSICF